MSKQHCNECGGSPINHTLTYLSSLVSLVLDPVIYSTSAMMPTRFFDQYMPAFVRALAVIGLASARTTPPTSGSWRSRALWEEANRRNIHMTEYLLLGKSCDVFVCSFENDERYFEGLPRPRVYNESGGQWMDYKSKMKDHFVAAGIPVARGGTAWTKSTALRIFDRIEKPAIVKPNDGSRSRHTRVHISDRKALIEAYKSARKLGPFVMIEEELSGSVFRGTLIDKKLVAVCRREPAYVTGDGVHTVKELLDTENQNPLRLGPLFQQIAQGEEAEKELAHMHRSWTTVPAYGEYVALGQKTSRAVGGGITDVTDMVHLDNKALLEKVAAVVDDPLIGVDFIMEDIARSWKEQPRSGVIECNGSPFIDLHQYPLVGQSRNAAGALWDLIYPSSASAHHQQ